MPIPRLDADQYRWVRYHDDSSPLYTVDYEQTVLGYDREAGTFDMILRFRGNGGHNLHRHVTTTSVLVIEGEQHLTNLLPGGETRQKVRRAGEHHLTTGDFHTNDRRLPRTQGSRSWSWQNSLEHLSAEVSSMHLGRAGRANPSD